MIESSTPILVGCGDVTDLATPVEHGRSPYELIAQAGRLALADTGAAAAMARTIDTVAMLRLFADTSHRFANRLGASSNPPRSIARRLGIEADRHIYTWNGGNMPQYLVNMFAEQIARGEIKAALICGGEALRTQHGIERQGLELSWREEPGGEPELVGIGRRGWNDHEDRHKLRAAIAMYPLFENAIRGQRGHTVAQHLQAMGTLFARFAAVAAANKLATRREGYTAAQLATVNEANRWIGFPYPRLMNANAFIDQSAALVMTSVGQARALGIPESKWVYLHGCADGHDHWYVTERIDFHSSPAIRLGVRQAMAMAGKTPAEMDFFDLYSCFPSAVEIGCQEIGLAEDDPRGLTLTGGLPYFGGPGNNYVTHSIAAMMRKLREHAGRFGPGAGGRNAYGLVTANGNYVTKHSFGIYSTDPTRGPWQRENPARLQGELDALPKAPFTETPDGAAHIETYTVMHGRHGPEFGLVIGRLDATGERFIANPDSDPAVLADLQDRESLGRPGVVESRDGHNRFVATA